MKSQVAGTVVMLTLMIGVIIGLAALGAAGFATAKSRHGREVAVRPSALRIRDLRDLRSLTTAGRRQRHGRRVGRA